MAFFHSCPDRSIGWRMLGLAVGWTLCMSSHAAVQSVMGADTARAMLQRFGYGGSAAQIEQTAKFSIDDYLWRAISAGSYLPDTTRQRIAAMQVSLPVAQLWEQYAPGGELSRRADMDAQQKKEFQQRTNQLVREAEQARLLAMANTDNPAHEVLLEFWLNHFSIYGPKGLDRVLAKDYADTLERALRQDSFEALLRASFLHPAMQIYLDNAQSTAPNSAAAQAAAQRGKSVGINENLAREVMELHTLGVDAGYSQKDVQELARIITGAGTWVPKMREQALQKVGATRIGLFLFDPRRHDFGPKVFLNQDYPRGHGFDEVERALHQLAMNPATAAHVCRQLAQRFVSDDPSSQLLDTMTAAWSRSGGRISAVLGAMVDTEEFRSSLAAGAKFKEPIDYVLSTAKAACQDQPIDNSGLLMAATFDMGETPFMKTTPDGYASKAGAWLSPAAMAKRIRWSMGIAAGKVPLRDGPTTAEQAAAARVAQPGDKGFDWHQGIACALDPVPLEAGVGALSASTLGALKGLGPNERVAALLATPEFLRR